MASRNNLVVRLVDAQARVRTRAQQQAADRAARLVAGWRGFHDPDDVAALIEALTRLVEPAQLRTATLTAAYLARVISALTGRAIAPVPVRVDPAALRQGTGHAEVFGRVAAEYRRQVAKGATDTTARNAAVKRVRVIVSDDLALAGREANRQVLTNTRGVTGYRRVVRPELSAGGTCGLCIVASDRTYSRGDLMPIHAHCKCEVLPIIGQQDPGKSLNSDELAALYKSAGGNTMQKLKRTRYRVDQHGELGPVLTDADHDFRGPAEVAADTAA